MGRRGPRRAAAFLLMTTMRTRRRSRSSASSNGLLWSRALQPLDYAGASADVRAAYMGLGAPPLASSPPWRPRRLWTTACRRRWMRRLALLRQLEGLVVGHVLTITSPPPPRRARGSAQLGSSEAVERGILAALAARCAPRARGQAGSVFGSDAASSRAGLEHSAAMPTSV